MTRLSRTPPASGPPPQFFRVRKPPPADPMHRETIRPGKHCTIRHPPQNRPFRHPEKPGNRLHPVKPSILAHVPPPVFFSSSASQPLRPPKGDKVWNFVILAWGNAHRHPIAAAFRLEADPFQWRIAFLDQPFIPLRGPRRSGGNNMGQAMRLRQATNCLPWGQGLLVHIWFILIGGYGGIFQICDPFVTNLRPVPVAILRPVRLQICDPFPSRFCDPFSLGREAETIGCSLAGAFAAKPFDPSTRDQIRQSAQHSCTMRADSFAQGL